MIPHVNRSAPKLPIAPYLHIKSAKPLHTPSKDTHLRISKISSKVFSFVEEAGTEVFALLRCAVLYPFRFNKNKIEKPAAGKEKGPHVLLAHGYFHNETPWGKFKKHLKNAGCSTVNTVAYPSLTKNIQQNSLVIKEKIEKIKHETGCDVNVLIGHSQGGIEFLEYALEHAPKDRIIHIVMLGTPLHGAKVAKFGIGRGIEQLEIDSAYMKSLHERLAKAKHIHLYAIASKFDKVVQPPESARADEFPFAKTDWLEDVGHAGYFFKNRVHKMVDKYLKDEGVLS